MKGRVVKGEPDGPKKEGARTSTSPAGRKVIKQEVHSAREEGKRIVEEAKTEASRLVEEAKAEVERIREEAHAVGYEQGLAKLNELVLEFEERQTKLLEESRNDVLRLAVKIAGKILGRELAANDKALADVVVKAIRGIRHEKRIQIRVSPDDLERARSCQERIADEVGPGKEIEIREDKSVSPGGCIVETDLGIIDARLETQLRVLEKALLARKPT